MVLEVRYLEGRQFAIPTNVHRYFRKMGDRAQSAWFSVRKENIAWVSCYDHLDPVFVVDFFVDEVFHCSWVNHGVDCDQLSHHVVVA